MPPDGPNRTQPSGGDKIGFGSAALP
jgi:hypothetical protein